MLTAMSSIEKVVTAAVGNDHELEGVDGGVDQRGRPHRAAAGDIEVAERDRGDRGDSIAPIADADAVVDDDRNVGWRRSAAWSRGRRPGTAARRSRRKAKPRQTISSASPWKAKIPSRIHGQSGDQSGFRRRDRRGRQRKHQQDEGRRRRRLPRGLVRWGGRVRGVGHGGANRCLVEDDFDDHGRGSHGREDREPPTPGGVDLGVPARTPHSSANPIRNPASRDLPATSVCCPASWPVP